MRLYDTHHFNVIIFHTYSTSFCVGWDLLTRRLSEADSGRAAVFSGIHLTGPGWPLPVFIIVLQVARGLRMADLGCATGESELSTNLEYEQHNYAGYLQGIVILLYPRFAKVYHVYNRWHVFCYMYGKEYSCNNEMIQECRLEKTTKFQIIKN